MENLYNIYPTSWTYIDWNGIDEEIWELTIPYEQVPLLEILLDTDLSVISYECTKVEYL